MVICAEVSECISRKGYWQIDGSGYVVSSSFDPEPQAMPALIHPIPIHPFLFFIVPLLALLFIFQFPPSPMYIPILLIPLFAILAAVLAFFSTPSYVQQIVHALLAATAGASVLHLLLVSSPTSRSNKLRLHVYIILPATILLCGMCILPPRNPIFILYLPSNPPGSRHFLRSIPYRSPAHPSSPLPRIHSIHAPLRCPSSHPHTAATQFHHTHPVLSTSPTLPNFFLLLSHNSRISRETPPPASPSPLHWATPHDFLVLSNRPRCRILHTPSFFCWVLRILAFPSAHPGSCCAALFCPCLCFRDSRRCSCLPAFVICTSWPTIYR